MPRRLLVLVAILGVFFGGACSRREPARGESPPARQSPARAEAAAPGPPGKAGAQGTAASLAAYRDEGLLPSAAMGVYLLLKETGVSTAAYARISRELVGDLKGIGVAHVVDYLTRSGFPARAEAVGLDTLLRDGQPALILLRTKRTAAAPTTGRFALLKGPVKGGVRVAHPVEGLRVYRREELAQAYLGVAIRLQHPAPRPARAAPDIVPEELVWNFGEVATGARIEHSFRIRNAGSEPLRIHRVETTCGCAAAVVRKTPQGSGGGNGKKPPAAGAQETLIPPGETAWVAAHVDTRGKQGYQNFRISLVTNDPEEPEVHLSLQGHVVQLYQVDPLTLWFPEVYAAEGATGYLWVRHHQAKPVRIVDLKASSPHVALRLDPEAPREAPAVSPVPGLPPRAHPAREGWVAVRVRLKPGLPVGGFAARIQFKADQTPMEVHVAAQVKGNLEVQPAYFAFGHVRRGEPAAATVTVVSRRAEGFAIRKAEVDRDFMEVDVQEAGRGSYRVTVRLRPGWQAYDLRGVVTLHTTDPLEPQKQILVYGFVRPGNGED